MCIFSQGLKIINAFLVTFCAAAKSNARAASAIKMQNYGRGENCDLFVVWARVKLALVYLFFWWDEEYFDREIYLLVLVLI